MRIVHTADWQIGKAFGFVRDPDKRARLRRARVEAVLRIGRVARDAGARLVLVAGDLFDSPHPDKATVAAACEAIGRMELPVLVIPGNHDHAGPGGVWEQEFFLREQAASAPNLIVLREARPYECEGLVVLPCPLSRRHHADDPTAWLRSPEIYEGLDAGAPRVVLAHGSTQDFTAEPSSHNRIDLERLPGEPVDYVALGDWHGAKQVGGKAWYSGTPEPDRFPSGAGREPGHVLVVDVRRGEPPEVHRESTGSLRWCELAVETIGAAPHEELARRVDATVGRRPGETLLRLRLAGGLGLEARGHLERYLEALEARLLHLEVDDGTHLAPTEAEVLALTRRDQDPLVAAVARRLVERLEVGGEDAEVARVALSELHAACREDAAT